MPRSAQRLGKGAELGRLAGPLPAFEADEAPARRSRHAEELLEADPDAAEEARFARPLRRRPAASTAAVSAVVTTRSAICWPLAIGALTGPLIDDLHLGCCRQSPAGQGHGEVARRDQRDLARRCRAGPWRCRPWRRPVNSGWACQARKPQSMSRTDSSIRWLKLSRPATTMTRRRPFCSAEPVKP